jgi:hypothetical protein
VVSSAEFARQIQQSLQQVAKAKGAGTGMDRRADITLKPDEIEAWLRFFQGESDQDKR